MIIGGIYLEFYFCALLLSHLIFYPSAVKSGPTTRTSVILLLNFGSLNEISRASCSQVICGRKFSRLSLFRVMVMTCCVKLVLTSLAKHQCYCSLNWSSLNSTSVNLSQAIAHR